MIKSKGLNKIFGLPAEDGKPKKNRRVKRLKNNDRLINPKPYPIPEEDSFIPLQEDSEEIKYNTRKDKA